jgi:hypothetical protein
MSQPTTTTKLSQKLEAMERSRAWLGRQLGVTRETANAWVAGREAVPISRQAQIAIFLGVKASDYFDSEGFAV